MVGADRHDFTREDARSFALAADAALLARLESAGRRVLTSSGLDPRTVVTSGSGESLARRLAVLLIPPPVSLVSLADLWGPPASTAACARALVVLARDHFSAGLD